MLMEGGHIEEILMLHAILLAQIARAVLLFQMLPQLVHAVEVRSTKVARCMRVDVFANLPTR